MRYTEQQRKEISDRFLNTMLDAIWLINEATKNTSLQVVEVRLEKGAYEAIKLAEMIANKQPNIKGEAVKVFGVPCRRSTSGREVEFLVAPKESNQ